MGQSVDWTTCTHARKASGAQAAVSRIEGRQASDGRGARAREGLAVGRDRGRRWGGVRAQDGPARRVAVFKRGIPYTCWG